MTQPDNKTKPWRDEELMRELYHEKRMSQQEIADRFDNEITQAGVGYCLDELGIEKRSRSEAARIRWLNEPLVMYTHRDGYELIAPRDGDDRLTVFMHRLLQFTSMASRRSRTKSCITRTTSPGTTAPRTWS